jgi:scyllo-inositol 2-dehydrogenase (NADP+)
MPALDRDQPAAYDSSMTIRTAIIGYGRNGSTMHAGPIEKNGEFEMTAVCDIDPERRRQAAERFRCPVFEDYREMLRGVKADLVVIVTRNDQHAAMACDGLRAGAHVLVTKPWAINVDEARRMVATARETGRLLLPWLPARWGCDLIRLRELIRAGAVGKVFAVRRTVCSFATRRDWQTEKKCGGGYVLNWGPHIVDPPVVLLGGKVKSVFGRLKQVINPGDVEDLFLAVLTLEDGTLVQAEYTISAEPFPNWVIQGDRGTIVMNGRQLKVVKQAPAQPVDPTRFGGMQAASAETTEEKVEGALYGDEQAIYKEIAAAVRGEAPYPVTPADALELSRVLDAIKVSAAENRVVVL